MVNINDTIDNNNLLQEAFLNRISQQLDLGSDISKHLFKLRYHPNYQNQRLTDIADIIVNKYKISFHKDGINTYAARVIKSILEIFKLEIQQDEIEVDSILNNPRGRNNIYPITYQWLWEKKFTRMGWKLSKEIASPAFDQLTMLDINENFEGENANSKRGLVFKIKSPDPPEPYNSNYIYLNNSYYLRVNLPNTPNNSKYLLLINETVEGQFYLVSPSRAFAYVPHTKLSEGLRLPPSEGLAEFFQYDAVGDEYFLAIVTENPMNLSWVNGEADPTDILLNKKRLEEIFIKLGQQGNSEVFYKRFKVIEPTINGFE